MECATLGELIETLEIGTKLHISITFLDEYGNRKTQRTRSQSIHDSPVCLTIKHQLGELASCYRCRNTVQKAVIQRRRSMAGVCTNGVYEYCRPVVYEDRVLTLAQLRDILVVNFEGHEDIRAKLLAAPKYGNNDDYVDKYAVKFLDWNFEVRQDLRTFDGGYFYMSIVKITCSSYIWNSDFI